MFGSHTRKGADHTYGASRFVTLDDGRRLHYRIRGNGSPTVVFESGAGMSGAVWGLVAPAIADKTTAVVYDRANSGGSDDDRSPRTMARIVADLCQLLRTLDGPFVLVGSSLGGPIVRSVAATGEFPIRGLVLVDQSDEHAAEFFTPANQRRMAQATWLAASLARVGSYRLLARVGRHQPADVYADLKRDFSVRGARHMAAELATFLPALRHLQDNPARLEGIEVAVLTGTKSNFLERTIRPAINRAHAATVTALDSARLVEAPGSAHNIMFSEPEIIVTEILSMT